MWETSFKNLSVCIITRDQCRKLKKCLEAVKECLPGADISLLDTGSRDDSLKTAGIYTDNIGEFQWCGDFAAAKNAAIDRAKNDTVLILDSDEYLLKGQKKVYGELFDLIRRYPEAVGRIKRDNSYEDPRGLKVHYEEWINRIFDRRLFRYEGRIHEQVTSVSGKGYKTFRTDIHVFHDGYDLSPSEKKEKALRNAGLLIEEIREKGDDPYLIYQLGKTYYVSSEKEKAASEFLKCLELKPDPDMEYMEDLLCLTGYALLDTGRAAEGLKLLKPFSEEERYRKNADFMFLYALLLMNTAAFTEARDIFIYCTTLDRSNTEGTSSFMAWYNAGVISEVTGDREKACTFYRKAGSFKGAEEGLKRCSIFFYKDT